MECRGVGEHESGPLVYFSLWYWLIWDSRSGISSKIITYLMAEDQTVAIQMRNFWPKW